MALVKKKPRITRKLFISDSTYLDPLDCDSTISYKVIRRSRHVSGSVQLADCYRKIEWYFANNNQALPKIDKAIEYMKAFRAAFVEARKKK